MKDFWGIGGYTRPADGFLSFEHLSFVTSLMVVMITLAVVLGLKYKSRPYEERNKVLIVAALLMDSLEIFKIVFMCIRSSDPMLWRYELPLFLCSIQLIALPLAAFSKGRVKEATLDFVFIFGILGAVLGTYGAGNNYGSYPAICFDNVISGLTHCTAGFASLYIGISNMKSMKKRNIFSVFFILTSFCAAAHLANEILDYNYMFLVRGDGTPYEILYSLVNGHSVFYPLGVIVMFLVYISAFYGIYYLATGRKAEKKQ